MCVDYHALKKVTVKNRYTVRRIVDLLDKLQHTTVLSSSYLAQGYHQIQITDADVPKTSFCTPFGHYQWRVLNFNPATFQHLLNDKFPSCLYDFVLVYLDEILILSRLMEEHKEAFSRSTLNIATTSAICTAS